MDCDQEIYAETKDGGETWVFCDPQGMGGPRWNANPIEACPRCHGVLRFEDMVLVRELD